jgi:hypothetical protein
MPKSHYTQKKNNSKRHSTLWAKIVGLLAAIGVIAEGITHIDEIWSYVQNICCTDNTPHVLVTKRSASWGGDCLRFEFSNLPSEFRLGEIRLPIINPKIANLPGDQAADLLEAKVATLIDEDEIIESKPIKIKCGIAATQAMDAFSVDYCPVLKSSGVYGTFQTQPQFFAPGEQTPLSDIAITIEEGQKAIDLTMKHPKNLNAVLASGSSDCSEPASAQP